MRCCHLSFNEDEEEISCRAYFEQAEAKGCFFLQSVPGQPPNLPAIANKLGAQILSGAPTGYGTDVDVEDENSNNPPLPWNLHRIPNCILREHLPDTNVPKIAGVDTPYYYIGEMGSVFPMHEEDHSLMAISILRYGAPKLWFGPIPSDREEFERLVSSPTVICYITILRASHSLQTFRV